MYCAMYVLAFLYTKAQVTFFLQDPKDNGWTT